MKKIAKGFSSIPHLSGSKMTSNSDIRLLNGEKYFTEKVKEKNDIVYVMEKIDGCCMSVSRIGDSIIPATRAGYDIDDGSFPHLKAFLPFVEKNKDFFLGVLEDGDSLYGEWTYANHGTNITYEKLFYVFDIRKKGVSIALMEIVEKIDNNNNKKSIGYPYFTTGCKKPEDIYKEALHGASSYEEYLKIISEDDQEDYYNENDPFEGWVYRSEKIRSGKLVIELAKWVRPGYEAKLPQ